MLSFLFQISFAKKVDINTAKKLATNYYYEQINSNRHVSYQDLIINETYIISQDGLSLFYIFNYEKLGFVMISADDSSFPIIGYSFENNYDNSNIPDNLNAHIQGVKEQIFQIIKYKVSNSQKNINAWEYLMNIDKNKINRNVRDVEPLLLSLWDQGSPYNDMCPGGSVTGCVATAMSQIMFFYRYPLQGVGSHSYYENDYGVLSANFGSTNYNWDNMVIHPNVPNSAIATLNYHAGVSVNMDYSPASSGAYSEDVADAFQDYFSYNTSSLLYKSNYTNSVWENFLKTESDNNRVVYYAAVAQEGGGHAFVCDGYQEGGTTDMFHINWGWSGSGNGYFYLNDMNSGNGHFTESQRMIKNIYPSNGYPYGCTGNHDITNFQGIFDDGSGLTANYADNANCTWLINPDFPSGYSSIIVNFNYFNTEADDVLTIYDGNSEAAPILGTFSGNTIPSEIRSTGETMFIKFVTNATDNNEGWLIEYDIEQIEHCDGTLTLTDASGNFSDGSGEYDYANNSNCKWKLKPLNATSLTVDFTSFNTMGEDDYLKVYDKYSGGSLIGRFYGSDLPPQLTSSNGSMLIMFRTDDYGTSTGWEASYSSSIISVEDFNDNLKIRIFPNPTKDIINIQTTDIKDGEINVKLVNIVGQVVLNKTYQYLSNLTNVQIDLSNFNKGIYILEYSNGNVSKYKTIIIE